MCYSSQSLRLGLLFYLLFILCFLGYNLSFSSNQYIRYSLNKSKALFFVQKIEGASLWLLFLNWGLFVNFQGEHFYLSILALALILNLILVPAQTVLFIKAKGLHTTDKINLWTQLVIGYIYFLFMVAIPIVGCYFSLQRRREHRQAAQEIFQDQEQRNKKRADVLRLFQRLPSVPFTQIRVNFQVCPVCLNEPQDKLLYKRLPCGHHLHGKCAIDWFDTELDSNKALSCPVCRKLI